MIAYVDGQRQLVVIDNAGREHPQTGDESVLWASWGQHTHEDVHSWPAWSPDGRQLAAFRIAKNGQSSRVWVTSFDKNATVEVAAMGNRVPIYLQWSVEGSRLAVLSQDDNELVLQQADPNAVQEDRELLRGSPLFFSWLPGERVAAFVGEGDPAQPSMAIVGPEGQRRDLPGAPGNFCAPVRLAKGLAYVAHRQNRVVILTSTIDGSHISELETVDGLVALLASPDGKILARAISPDGSGSPYHHLSLLDIETAEITAITALPCVAFYWLPSGDGLMVAIREPKQPAVTWHRVGLDGSNEPLFELVPSRDTRVYLRFFEQYGPSHPVIDPNGESLLLCGSPVDNPELPSRVWRVPLAGGRAEEIGEGLFATFAPPDTPEP